MKIIQTIVSVKEQHGERSMSKNFLVILFAGIFCSPVFAVQLDIPKNTSLASARNMYPSLIPFPGISTNDKSSENHRRYYVPDNDDATGVYIFKLAPDNVFRFSGKTEIMKDSYGHIIETATTLYGEPSTEKGLQMWDNQGGKLTFAPVTEPSLVKNGYRTYYVSSDSLLGIKDNALAQLGFNNAAHNSLANTSIPGDSSSVNHHWSIEGIKAHNPTDMANYAEFMRRKCWGDRSLYVDPNDPYGPISSSQSYQPSSGNQANPDGTAIASDYRGASNKASSASPDNTGISQAFVEKATMYGCSIAELKREAPGLIQLPQNSIDTLRFISPCPDNIQALEFVFIKQQPDADWNLDQIVTCTKQSFPQMVEKLTATFGRPSSCNGNTCFWTDRNSGKVWFLQNESSLPPDNRVPGYACEFTSVKQ